MVLCESFDSWRGVILYLKISTPSRQTYFLLEVLPLLRNKEYFNGSKDIKGDLLACKVRRLPLS